MSNSLNPRRRYGFCASPGNRAGFALPAVLLLLMVLSTVSVFFLISGSDEQRAGRAMRESARTFYATDAGLNAVLAEWDSLRYDTLMTTPGDSVDLGLRTLENGATYLAQLQRIDDGTENRFFAVTVRGQTGAGARSMVSMILRWRKVWPLGDPTAAIFAAVGLKKSSPLGMNTGADACTTDAIGGLGVPVGGLQYSGDPEEVFGGAPPVVELTDPVQTMNDVGLDWAAIKAGDFDYTISATNQFPDFSTLPSNFYPSILFTGTRLTVKGWEFNGRGLLVVENELKIQSDWVWEGAVLVGDDFATTGQFTIRGALSSGLNLQLGKDPADMRISDIGPGAAQVTYDSCALAKATGWTSKGLEPVQVVDGSWAAGW